MPDQFGIKNKMGEYVPISELDIMACNLWDKKIHKYEYAYPGDDFANNWYDVVGFTIASDHNIPFFNEQWKNVVNALYLTQLSGTMYESKGDYNPALVSGRMESIINYIRPFANLCHLFESAGLIPVKLQP